MKSMESWVFSVYVDNRYYRLTAEVIYRSDQVERICVKGRDRSIVLQNNRPLFRGKGLKHRRPNWKLIEGTGNNAYALERIIAALSSYLDRMDV
ncbi:MAG: hypothetical protein HYI21_10780 [Sediminibacterium sp. Gen4]|jgi:hypothetical protein|uniref:hypothetical protein n=1 Tax=Sediminibacterium sp. Gen4 TaxID=2736285 RepID=UPI0015BB62AF|nr:hypothetical protein [Sediminibacterium sp. Gen4]MBW0162197.1 hypothetical protein [Sediminibacterium sp.]NWK66503.1 hypothetical protein [Sediminibacterium sp. Gen4]